MANSQKQLSYIPSFQSKVYKNGSKNSLYRTNKHSDKPTTAHTRERGLMARFSSASVKIGLGT